MQSWTVVLCAFVFKAPFFSSSLSIPSRKDKCNDLTWEYTCVSHTQKSKCDQYKSRTLSLKRQAVIICHQIISAADCHAEIVSRRCLLSFLYSQLEMLSSEAGSKEKSIFLPRLAGGGYQLRPDIRFHLFINTAPCGDARIFSPHEVEAENNPAASVDPHPNRKARGQLRTKIESGEGTIPVKSSDGIQTWDGVLQGSRLLTMSCSGKL